MPRLCNPFTVRSVTLRNRIGVSPMCQYSSPDGLATDWHLVHLGSRAVGGAGLVMTEATAVTAPGRISPQDLGLWEDRHVEPLARVVRFLRNHGAAAAAVRSAVAERMPLLVRISATDWAEGGWDVEQSVALARELARQGVDLIDCSSGGLVPHARIPVGPGYQVALAERVRREGGI